MVRPRPAREKEGYLGTLLGLTDIWDYQGSHASVLWNASPAKTATSSVSPHLGQALAPPKGEQPYQDS